MDSAAKNYPEILRDQNKYATFDFLANPVHKWPNIICDMRRRQLQISLTEQKETKIIIMQAENHGGNLAHAMYGSSLARIELC